MQGLSIVPCRNLPTNRLPGTLLGHQCFSQGTLSLHRRWGRFASQETVRFLMPDQRFDAATDFSARTLQDCHLVNQSTGKPSKLRCQQWPVGERNLMEDVDAVAASASHDGRASRPMVSCPSQSGRATGLPDCEAPMKPERMPSQYPAPLSLPHDRPLTQSSQSSGWLSLSPAQRLPRRQLCRPHGL